MSVRAGRLGNTLGAACALGYAALLVGVFLALVAAVRPERWGAVLGEGGLGRVLLLTAATSTAATLIALAIALPAAAALRRGSCPLPTVVDVLLDLPMSLSPLVLGMGLLLLFAGPPGRWIEDGLGALGIGIRGTVAGVVLGQVAVATAFAIRGLRQALELVPLVAGELPSMRGLWAAAPQQARRAAVVAATITWARTVGEFGPILILVGIVPGRTEVLSAAIYLRWTSGDLEAAAAAAALMMAFSFAVVLVLRRWRAR